MVISIYVMTINSVMTIRKKVLKLLCLFVS